MCSGNGVCNFGKEGTGRCMCGGNGGMATAGAFYPCTDQDFRPKSAQRIGANSGTMIQDATLNLTVTWTKSVQFYTR